MNAWLKQNWKYLLVAVAGFVIVILLYLRSRSSSAPASTISFPPTDLSGGGGSGVASTVSSAVSAITTTAARVVPRPPGYGIDVPGQPGSGIPIYPDAQSTSLLTELPWGSAVQVTGPAIQGRSVPGRGNLWVPVTQGQVSGFAFAEDLVGQGGPGLDPAQAAANLGRAAVARQAASHRAALRSARLSRRLSHDSVQAAAEIQRMNQESRGAAPVGGPLGQLRARWPR